MIPYAYWQSQDTLISAKMETVVIEMVERLSGDVDSSILPE